jgi:hypothetical protein
MNINDIQAIAQARAQMAVYQAININRSNISTIDDTPTEASRLTIDAGHAGMIEVKAVGFDGTEVIAGVRKYAFYELAGDLVLTQIGTGEIHTGLAADFYADVDAGQLVVMVEGIAATDINWNLDYNLLMVEKISAL